MFPPPVAVGLTLCSYVSVEEGSQHRISLIDCFTRLRLKSLPGQAVWFAVATLTNGLGDVTIQVVVEHLETSADVYARQVSATFANKLLSQYVIFPMQRCLFGQPGTYSITLLANGEWVAQRRFVISLSEETP